MNKGFTIIEVLAVMVVLAIVTVITVPNLMGSVNVSKQKAYENQVQTIEKAAQRWLVDNQTGENKVSVEKLLEDGYISSNGINNPETNEPMDGCVYITKSEGKYKYNYQEEC